MKRNNQEIERYRIRKGNAASDESYGNNGAFRVPVGTRNCHVIASDGMGWEHVSVSLPDRCLTWGEMCQIKDIFWEEDEAVMQLHPAKADYVNNHPYCLHLWRPTDEAIPLPPSGLVGIRNNALMRAVMTATSYRTGRDWRGK